MKAVIMKKTFKKWKQAVNLEPFISCNLIQKDSIPTETPQQYK